MQRDYLDFWEIIHLNLQMIIVTFIIIVIPTIIMCILTWKRAKKGDRKLLSISLLSIFLIIPLLIVAVVSFVYSVNTHTHQAYITGHDTVTVKDVNKSKGDNYWTFESNGHTYKVTYGTNAKASSLPPQSLDKGDKVKVSIRDGYDVFVNKDNEINIVNLDCEAVD